MSERGDDGSWTQEPTSREVREQMQAGEPYVPAGLLSEFGGTSLERVRQRLEDLAERGEIRRKQHGQNRVTYWVPADSESGDQREPPGETHRAETERRSARERRRRDRQSERDARMQRSLIGMEKDGAVHIRLGPVWFAVLGALFALSIMGMAVTGGLQTTLVVGSVVVVPLIIGVFYIALDLASNPQ